MTDDLKKVEARVQENARLKSISKSNMEAYAAAMHRENQERLEASKLALMPIKGRLVEFKNSVRKKMSVSIKEKDGRSLVSIGARYGWIQKPLFLLSINPRGGKFDVSGGDYISRSGLDIEGVIDALAEVVADAISMGDVGFKFSESAKDVYKFGFWLVALIGIVCQGMFDIFAKTNSSAEEIKVIFWIVIGSAFWPLIVLGALAVVVLNLLRI